MKTAIPYPKSLQPVLDAFPRALLVGGSVRDHFLGLVPKDFDVEVYGKTNQEILSTLESFGPVKMVGAAFGVYKLTTEDGETYDFSAPRRDSKVPGGKGHKAVIVEFDPTITEIEAAARRDLTINALAWNPKNGDVLDFYNGLADLKAGVLKHTSVYFQDDPVRALRIFQFAARMGFPVDPETAKLCRTMAHQCADIAPARILEEFNKFLLKGKDHNAGFRALREIGWLAQFPELQALDGMPQDREYHPEGDVLTHTGHCLTALSRQERWQALHHGEKLITMYGMLTHDFGKATTTKLERKAKLNREVVVSPGHDKAGVAPALRFMERINVPKEIAERAAAHVSYHMEHIQLKGDYQIRRLAADLGKENLYKLGMIVEGDMSGRPPLPARQAPAMQQILDRAEEMGCLHEKPKAILQGRDLVKWGIKPGPAIGVLLEAAYESQIRGNINSMEEGEIWFRLHRGSVLENAKLAPTRLFDGHALSTAAIPGGPTFGKVHRDLFEQQLDGKVKTRQDAVEFLKTNAEVYHLDPEVIGRLQAMAEATPAVAQKEK